MGHEILTSAGVTAILHDADLWLFRHLALEQLGARAGDAPDADASLRAYFSAWEWLGPGVYLNLDLPSPRDATWTTSDKTLMKRR